MIELILRLLLGLVFVASVLGKGIRPAPFYGFLRKVGVPRRAVPLTARLVMLTEFLTILLLALAPARCAGGWVLLLSLLFTIIAILPTARAGGCGCFGGSQESPLWRTLAVRLSMATAASLLYQSS